MKKPNPTFPIIFFVLFLFTGEISAQVSVAKIFSNNMVIQQNAETPIWGWAQAGDTIKVSGSWNNEEITSITNSAGKWLAKLNTPVATNDAIPYSIIIKGSNTITLSNVLIGEVWLLSGQSNMEMQLQGWTGSPIEGSAEAIARSNFPNIRLMTVNKKSAATPQKDIVNANTTWVKCSPSTSGNFSAVGFFFGRELYEKLNIPIGLVSSSWGGSSCETWAEESSLEYVSDFADKGPWNPSDTDDNQSPTVLYNGMIAPLIPFNFAGVCWYQGETNVGRPQQLTQLFPAMIEGWRNVFMKNNLPFYFVQLAPYGGYGGTSLPEFWEAQAYVLNLHHTEMAETLDAGDEENIHPAKKEPIGYRLAQKALANVYGKNELVFAGPRYDSLNIEGNEVRLYFSHTGSGLKAKNGTLTQFEIAGSNNIFYPATAQINGNEILVTSNVVSNPKNVRYAWNKNANASLYNKEGFPAPPFRTNPPSYIKSLNAEFFISSELIIEGETLQLRWTSIGSDEIKLNNEDVNPSGTIEESPDSTTTFNLVVTNSEDEISVSRKAYVIPKELNSWSENKMVSASSSRLNYNPEYAVDGNNSTHWSSSYSSSQWISIDLGESIPINLVILNWANDYGKIYEIQVSDDKENWNTIFTEKNGNGALDFIPNLNGNGRYVRMKGIARSGSRGYDLVEFRIFSPEFRKIGTLNDKNRHTMRGTPMVLGKKQRGSVQFASDINNWFTIKNNGFNTVRVCWVDPWYMNHNYDHWTVSEVLPYFDKCVQNATEAGMNIIINYHDVGAQQMYDTTYSFQHEKEFWDSLAPRYKDNDLVYYEIANEPTFLMTDYLKPLFKQNLLGIYSQIRKTAPDKQILMFSFNTIKSDILNVIENYKNDIDWNFTSIAYHMYNSNTSQVLKSLMAYHRVICTEWNYNHVSKKEGFEYIKKVDELKENSETLEKIGSSWIDWRDWNDTTLNELLDTLILDAKLKNYWWGEPVEGLKATGIKVFPSKTNLQSGKTKQLLGIVYPALAENPLISWNSSNENYVSVSGSGLISAISTQNKNAIITATSDDGGFDAISQVQVIPPEKKGAYPDGIPHKIPGTINPTHYDLGGEGVGYHDLNASNGGDGIRQEQGVDTEYRLESGSVGGIQTGEWLEYSIEVEKEGIYSIEILFATPGRFGKIHIEFDEVDKTGLIYVNPTSGYNNFRITSMENIHLNKGEQIMRIFFDYASYNMGTISIREANTTNLDAAKTNEFLTLYPNPVKDKLYISGHQFVTNYTVKNILGQIVTKGNSLNNNSIDTSYLPTGNYIVSLKGNDFDLTKKVVKL